MNALNAYGFIATGLLMEALHFLPSVTGVREMWLMIMGVVLVMIGSSVLAHAAWLRVAPRLAALAGTISARQAQVREQVRNGAAPSGNRVRI